ncbi:hypothetical protein TSUD_158350 [Trifolium subterraneum]|uniref:Mediator of RNA polymerase II transcription subunit 21 n=1 Tax=Trifolium subterraneum TaxID=3900 RepID=A0A2Z6NR45_TRISU|nr:hypothetical protein TSUD_158350 [Trifolium subterraneum]
MDTVSQLQEQVNLIANLAFNNVVTYFSEQSKLMTSTLVKAAKQFDAFVASLPISETGEEAQLERITQLQACDIKAPGFGENRKSGLEDLAIITGGQLITEDLGHNLEKVDMGMFDSCQKDANFP